MAKGYIPIKRKLFEHEFFKEKRIYSRFEAWIDFIQMASFSDDNKQIIKGKLIESGKGEIVASVRYLMERWRWGNTKVRNFLTLCTEQKMITVTKAGDINKIRLVNYARHNETQDEQKANEKQHSQQHTKTGDSKGIAQIGNTPDNTQTNHSQDGDNTNINKGNKENKVNSFLDEQKKEFAELLVWMEENAGRVLKMKEPLTIDQYFKLKEKYGKVGFILKKMHNHKPLLEKNISAYLTCINWLDRETANTPKQQKTEATGQPLRNAADMLAERDRNKLRHG